MSGTAVFTAGSTALITGGASGVGLAIAKLCRSKGMNVLVADRNAEALASVQSELSGNDSNVGTAYVDVSSTDDWEKLKETAISKFGSIEFLVLNAGIGMKGGWGDQEYFRKDAAKSKPTSIVITGSKQGITNPPGNPAYNASKAAVKSLAEQLSFDLKGTNTSVHLLVPGWTHTGLTGAGKVEKPAGAWSPEQVADYLYKTMEDNKFWAICPDNDVTEETDKKRMLWSVGDIISNRPPLSRWRDEYKDEAAETMAKLQV